MTPLEFFNQDPNGDYADWAGWFPNGYYCSPQSVQDAFGCTGNPTVYLNRNSIEVTALQAIGYDLGVPEPATWAMLILGLGMVGAVLRRRGALAAA